MSSPGSSNCHKENESNEFLRPLRLEPEKAPVKIDTSSFGEENLLHLNGILQVINEQLFHWKRFPIHLPEPVAQSCGSPKKQLKLEDLFIQPNFNELGAIAVGANGGPINLNEEQLESLRRSGEFDVNSIQFPGQKHKWLVSQILVKGRDKALLSFRWDLGRALYLILCVAKSCINGRHFSVVNGLNGWTQGLTSIMDMIFGLPLMDTIDLPQKLHEERSKYLVAELICSSADALEHLKGYLTRFPDQGRLGWKDEPPPIPYRFQTPNGLDIDLRLFSTDVMSSAKPHLLRILSSSLQGWFLTRRQELGRSLQKEKMTDDEMAKTASEILSREYLTRVCDAVSNDPDIKAIGPGIPELLVNQLKTSVVIQGIIRETEDSLAQMSKDFVALLKEQHPILSNVDSWRNDKDEQARMRFSKENEWLPHEKAIRECNRLSLLQSEYFLSRDLAFRRDREPLLLKELRKVKEPSRTFRFTAHIWNPKQWVVKERKEDGEYQVIPTVLLSEEEESADSTLLLSTSAAAAGKYLLQRERVYTSSTRYPLWRWSNLSLRIFCWFWNVLFVFGVLIPWCSSVSFRALLRVEPFHSGFVVGSEGRLMRDPSSRISTVSSRLTSLWSHVRRSRDAFEALPDTGLLSKNISRHLNVFVNYVLKGGIGTVACVVVLPVAFALCSGISLLLAATAIVWVPIGGALVHLALFLFYDLDGVSPLDAVVWSVVVNILCLGVVMPAAAATVAFVVCPVGALVLATLAVLRRASRDAWDAAVFRLFLKKKARVPSQNNFLARRIAGPGLASEYLYQIKPEQALVALETRMELEEIEAYERLTASRIREPLNNYYKLMRRLFEPFGLEPSRRVKGPCLDIEKETDKLLADLREKTARRRLSLGSQQLSASVTSNIRLQDGDLRLVLANSAAMVRDFFPPRVFSLLSRQERAAFWEGRGLPPDDWLGLACSLLKEFFSEGFLTPLQESDTFFSLQVKEWNLSQYMNMVMESSWRDDLDLAQIMCSQPSSRGVRQPEIPLESFNPESGFSRLHAADAAAARFSSGRRLFSDRWHLCKVAKKSSGLVPVRLTNPVPVPHPIDIALVILQRDCPNEQDLANATLMKRLNLMREGNQPLLNYLQERAKSEPSLSKSEDHLSKESVPAASPKGSQGHSVYEIDVQIETGKEEKLEDASL